MKSYWLQGLPFGWVPRRLLWPCDKCPFPIPYLAAFMRYCLARKKYTGGLRSTGILGLGKKRSLLQRAQHRIHGANRIRAVIEGCLLRVVELVLDDFFPSLFAYHNGHT